LFDASDRNILCQSLLGNKCVVGSADHGLKEFDTNTGKQIRELYNKKSGHSEWVTCVSHLSDGRIVSGGMDNKLCLWGKGGSRSCTDLIGHSGSISSVCTSASASHIISTSYDKTIRVWNTRRGSEVTALRGHTAPVLDLDWSTEGRGLLLTGDRAGMACIWDLESGSHATSLKNHRGHVTALKWLNGGQTCVTGDQAGTMRLWDSRLNSSNGCVQEYQNHPGGAINDFQLSGSYLVSTGADTKIQVLDFRGGGGGGGGGGGSGECECVHTWTSHRDFIYSLDTMNEYVVTGSGDGLMLFHSIRTGKLLYGMGASQGAVRCIDATSHAVVASGDDGNTLVYTF
jgi:WD40 repeat protein